MLVENLLKRTKQTFSIVQYQTWLADPDFKFMLLIYIFWLIVGFLIYSNFQIELSKLLLYNLHLKKFFNVPDLYAAVGYTLLQTIHSMTLKAVIALRTIDEAISLVYWFKCNSRSMCAQIWWFSDTSPLVHF